MNNLISFLVTETLDNWLNTSPLLTTLFCRSNKDQYIFSSTVNWTMSVFPLEYCPFIQVRLLFECHHPFLLMTNEFNWAKHKSNLNQCNNWQLPNIMVMFCYIHSVSADELDAHPRWNWQEMLIYCHCRKFLISFQLVLDTTSWKWNLSFLTSWL